MRYKVTFYQCGVYGIDDEHYATKREAQRNACEFLKCFSHCSGHRYSGSVYRDGYARIIDFCGLTEALAEVHQCTS